MVGGSWWLKWHKTTSWDQSDCCKGKQNSPCTFPIPSPGMATDGGSGPPDSPLNFDHEDNGSQYGNQH
eukprot:4281992-Karenia_brevis.AAC.1